MFKIVVIRCQNDFNRFAPGFCPYLVSVAECHLASAARPARAPRQSRCSSCLLRFAHEEDMFWCGVSDCWTKGHPLHFDCVDFHKPCETEFDEEVGHIGFAKEGDVHCPQCKEVVAKDENGVQRFGLCALCLALLSGDHVEALADAIIKVVEKPPRKKARPSSGSGCSGGGGGGGNTGGVRMDKAIQK